MVVLAVYGVRVNGRWRPELEGEMTPEKIKTVQAEAQRLFKAVSKMEAAAKEEGGSYIRYGSKLSGAVRRASMDLTRALSDLRRPG